GLAEGEECKLRLLFQKRIDDRIVRLVYLSRVNGGVHFECELPAYEASDEDEDIFDHDWN
ncbi:MAG: hypothetical protein Q4P72_05995, partial [Eubacteriales bacterium]|nr:hypothetical protein [Eubacteriales bacterium]